VSAPLLGLFAKYPQAGQVKTRLTPDLSLEQAADLYRAMLLDIIENSTQQRGFSLALWYTPPEQRAWFAKHAPSFELYAQRGSGLAQRMGAFFETHASRGSRRMLLRGTDSPTLPAQLIREGLKALEDCDLVLGPGLDGGYNLIGLREPCAALFEPEMSQADLLQQTLHAASAAGLRYRLLQPTPDIDTIQDLRALSPDQVPQRTAHWLVSERDSIAP